MKVVYHPRYEAVYAGDPAAKAGRMESIVREVSPHYEFLEPEPASVEDVRLVHTDWHIANIQKSDILYELALLATGGAIKASDLAMGGEPAFGLIRPPGHHASPDHCWGFCFFNNVTISVARLRQQGRIDTAAIVDFDLHFGDGTDAFFERTAEVSYFHPESPTRQDFVDGIRTFLAAADYDIIAVSAGFDRHEKDWGRLLATEDYEEIGRVVRDFSESRCRGRRYGVLEGGYNHSVLGLNVKAFLDGMA